MYIKDLELKNFRNYESLKIQFDKHYNIIYGENAQGKTNILEAIFMCASGRSHRTSKDMELLRFDTMKYLINLQFVKDEINGSIELTYEKNEKKKIKINEVPMKKIGSLMGNLNAVIFSPEDLLIIKEGPSERRRFLDITISQIKPTYFYDLQQYIKIIAQRNVLLRDIEKNKNLLETLEIWNTHLTKIGARIIKIRKEFIERLNRYIEKNHHQLTKGKERLILSYQPSFQIHDFSSIEKIEEAFLRAMDEIKRKEIIKGTTLLGPQRDDYEMLLNGASVKQYGSQGQQRTSILSIKLSEIDIIKDETGEYPVLLLDDVMSELDVNRQEHLFKSLTNIQTFITCTEKEFFTEKEIPAKYFKVSKGEIIREID